MFAEERRGRHLDRRIGKLHGTADGLERAPFGMGDLDHDAPLGEGLVLDQLLHVEDRAAGDAAGVERPHDLVLGVILRPFLDHPEHFPEAGHPGFRRRIVGVVDEVVAPDDLH